VANVIRSKSAVGHISLPLAGMSLLVCILWTLYGLQQEDVWITLPNGVGGLLSGLQVLVYTAYRGEGAKPYQKV
jgi:hypothetical protein